MKKGTVAASPNQMASRRVTRALGQAVSTKDCSLMHVDDDVELNQEAAGGSSSARRATKGKKATLDEAGSGGFAVVQCEDSEDEDEEDGGDKLERKKYEASNKLGYIGAI